MPLAAPLILPFAELAGITIAGLGMAAASEKVGDFISENPELSKQILITLVPGGAGLNTLFKKEAGITLEDLDEMTDEEAADLSKEDKAGIMKEVGKSKGGDKRQRMIEISEKLGLSGEGKEKQTIVDEVEERYDEGGVEDAPKPKFDYKKFFRNRRADGGAIGIEVLFEEKKDGGRIGFANGGDNIIGADLKDEGKGVLGKADTRFNALDLVPGLEQHIQDLEGIKQTTRGPEYFQKSTENMIQNFSDAYGRAPGVGGINQALIETTAPVSSLVTSPFYDAYSAYDRMEPGSGFKGFRDALAEENIGTAMVNRALGATQPLADRIQTGNFPLSLTNVMDMGKNVVDMGKMATGAIGDFFFTPAGAAEISPTTNRNFDRDFSQLPSYGNTPTRTNVQGRDLEADLGTRINPDIQPSLNMFQRAGNFIGELDLEDYLPFVGEKSLTRMLGQGVGNLFRGIAPARYGYSTDRFNRMTPSQQSYTSSLYGPGGLLQGYNQRSAFGLGALGTLGNRLTAIQNRRAPQTAASLARQQEIKDAINRTINTGESEALSDRNRSVDYGITGGRTRTDIDVADGGAESGGGGKIVCTMMNESYGFGNFRNKIWLKHSRDLPKEYEIGYHTIFLPLVKFAKGEGKLNKVVKKTLEHIARHRTLDLKQEMKGKTHALGRVYRKILEPICLMVGKIKKAVK